MKTEKYVGVEVMAFSQGMRKMFQGIAEVFDSLGEAMPKTEDTERWLGDHIAPQSTSNVTKDAENAASGTDGNAAVNRADDENDSSRNNMCRTDSAVHTASDTSADKAADKATEKPVPQSVKSGGAVEKNPDASKPDATSNIITPDDLLKIVHHKLKMNKDRRAEISDKIGLKVKSFGVSLVSEIPISKYEEFLTFLAQF